MSPLLLLVGPSGAGKTTLAHGLARNGVPELVSHTTRARRAGEVEGVSYYFVSDAEFSALVDGDAMLEHVTYGGHRYGVSLLSAVDAMERGPCCVVVESGGARQIKRRLGDRAKVIFLFPPPLDELRARMLARGDAPESVEKRLATVEEETLDAEPLADFVILASLPEDAVLQEALRIVDGR